MEEEVLALGQREIDATTGITSFSDEELKLVSDAGLTVDKLIGFVTETGRQTINAAIGGVKEFELPKESNAPPTVEGEFEVKPTEVVAGVDEIVPETKEPEVTVA